jgi:alpha-ribazole phosphatase
MARPSELESVETGRGERRRSRAVAAPPSAERDRESSLPTPRLTLVRHGETIGQSSIRYYGRTDVSLSGVGEAQMRRVRAAVAGERFDAVFSSRLQRSRRSAELVAGDAAVVTPVAAFDEIDFGRWEGWTRHEIAMRDPDDFRAWQSHGESFHYPEGESRPAFRARVVAGLAEALGEPVPRGILMVLHKGVIAVILDELLRLGPERRRSLGIQLGSIHVVERRRVWTAASLNRVDHLAGIVENER